MSALYSTITTDAAKTRATRRGHYALTAAAQSFDGTLAIEASRDRKHPDAPARFALCIGNGSTPTPRPVTDARTAEVWRAAAADIEAALAAAARRLGV